MTLVWKVIVNPKAGSSKGREEWPKIQKCFIEEGLNLSTSFTNSKFHAIELTKEAIKEGFRNFIAIGGDGTIHEVLNGIFDQKEIPTTEFTITAIPIGTGNDWGRLYDFPRQYTTAAKVIAAGKRKRQDIARVDAIQNDLPITRYMVNIGGMAFDAYTCFLFDKMKDKGMSGKSLYLLGLLKGFVKYRSRYQKIMVDEELFYEGQVFSVAFGIGKFSGGGMLQTPNAVPDDGLLDVTVIKKVSRLKILLNIHRLFKGTILSITEVINTKAKRVHIESIPTSYVEVDGENIGESPLQIEMIPSAINVIVP